MSRAPPVALKLTVVVDPELKETWENESDFSSPTTTSTLSSSSPLSAHAGTATEAKSKHTAVDFTVRPPEARGRPRGGSGKSQI
jgi:hypothetical protein